MRIAGGLIMAGKGSRPRPIPDRNKFDEAWDNIFGSKDKDQNKPKGSRPSKGKEDKGS